MMRLRTFFVLLAAFAVAARVYAHHGRGRRLRHEESGDLTGTVSLVKGRTPTC